MTTPTRDRATPPPTVGPRPATGPGPVAGAAAGVLQRRTLALLAAGILVAGLAAAVLALSDDPAPSRSSAITPVRVTSGGEIATGFAVGRERVVTVAHLVDGAVKEAGTDGAVMVTGVRARVLRRDRLSDLALLAVPGIGGRSPTVTAADAGDEVRVLRLRDGRSSSQSVRVRRAIVAHVSALGAEPTVTRPALELGARVRAGDSGAPVVSRSGALAGVIFAASSRREGTAYAVDGSAVARLLARD
jgi:S1-C subfamily serine protease